MHVGGDGVLVVCWEQLVWRILSPTWDVLGHSWPFLKGRGLGVALLGQSSHTRVMRRSYRCGTARCWDAKTLGWIECCRSGVSLAGVRPSSAVHIRALFLSGYAGQTIESFSVKGVFSAG
jgi:hypothetical protein